MSTAYNPQTDRQTERTNQVLEGYLRRFVNYDQKDWDQLLLLAEQAYTNSATKHKMTPFFANYAFHPQTEWMNEREAHNPGATMDAHWIQDIHRQAKQTLDNTRESTKKYYDRKATEQPSIAVGDLVMLNAKNIRTKRPSKKLSPKLLWPFQSVRKEGKQAIHVRNIAAVENSSCVSRFAVGTLPILEPTKLRTTHTRCRRH